MKTWLGAAAMLSAMSSISATPADYAPMTAREIVPRRENHKRKFKGSKAAKKASRQRRKKR